MNPQIKIYYANATGQQTLEAYVNQQLEQDGLRAFQIFPQQNTYGSIQSIIVHVEPMNAWEEERQS